MRICPQFERFRPRPFNAFLTQTDEPCRRCVGFVGGMCVSRVVVMRQDEPLNVDSDRLADMFVDLGEARAAQLVALSVERLEDLMAELDLATGQVRPGDCLDLARQIGALGDSLGLLSLSVAARGVARAVQSGDQVAVAATMARLRRLALRSFRIAAELQHRSG